MGSFWFGIAARRPRARQRYVVDGVEVKVIGECVRYYGPDGKLITESLRDYARACVMKQFSSLNEFLCRASLEKYADTYIAHIEDINTLQLDPFRRLGAPLELDAA